jgi:MtrB/PioB family decaheme-associated outer membrane protein
MQDLGLDSRSAEVAVGLPGQLDAHVSYREQPHFLFDTTQTIFGGLRGSALALPADWVAAGSTAGFAALNGDLRDADIESKRKTLGLGGKYLFNDRLSFAADYSHQSRNGVDLQSGSFVTTSSELPFAIDSTTQQLDLSLRYQLPRGDLALAYYGSFYNDDLSGLTWGNPFSPLASGASVGQLAAPPDNSFQQVRLSGSLQAPFNSLLSASVATGEMRQDDSFLPYTVNTALNSAALPRGSLDGKVDTTDLQLAVTSRPIARTRLKGAFHYDRRDNKTPQESWSIAESDSFSAGTFVNTPYSFTRRRLNLSGEYEVLKNLRASAGYDRGETDRSYQEVRDQTEETGWGQLRWQPLGYLETTVRGGATYRNIGRYDTSVSTAQDQNPLLRKYNLADRDRQFAEGSVSVTLPQAPVSIGATLYLANDDYRRSILGLTDSRERRVGADVSWNPVDPLSVFAHGGYERTTANQTGSESFSTPDWLARNVDRFRTAGAGMRWSGLGKRTDVTFDYTYAYGTGSILIDRIAGTPDRLPDLKTQLNSLRLSVLYHWSPALELSGGVRYEDFGSKDWALDGVEPATLPTVLTLGADAYNYNVTVVSLSWRYFFGARELAVKSDE